MYLFLTSDSPIVTILSYVLPCDVVVTVHDLSCCRNRKAKSEKKLSKSSPSNAGASPSSSGLPLNASTTLPPGGQLTNQGEPSHGRPSSLVSECVQTTSTVGAAPADPGSSEVSGVKSTGSDARGMRQDNRRRFQKIETNLARLKERRDKSLQRKSQLNMLPPDQPGGCHGDDLLSSFS